MSICCQWDFSVLGFGCGVWMGLAPPGQLLLPQPLPRQIWGAVSYILGSSYTSPLSPQVHLHATYLGSLHSHGKPSTSPPLPPPFPPKKNHNTTQPFRIWLSLLFIILSK